MTTYSYSDLVIPVNSRSRFSSPEKLLNYSGLLLFLSVREIEHMRFYGDTYTKMSGELIDSQRNFWKIRFQNQKDAIFVPKYLILHPVNQTLGIAQDFSVPTWFLKRQRIIPLKDEA